MKNTVVVIFSILSMAFAPLAARAGWDPKSGSDNKNEAEATIERFKSSDPALKRFFDQSHGMAVFPTVGKVGIGFGGAYGTDIAFVENLALFYFLGDKQRTAEDPAFLFVLRLSVMNVPQGLLHQPDPVHQLPEFFGFNRKEAVRGLGLPGADEMFLNNPCAHGNRGDSYTCSQRMVG